MSRIIRRCRRTAVCMTLTVTTPRSAIVTKVGADVKHLKAGDEVYVRLPEASRGTDCDCSEFNIRSVEWCHKERKLIIKRLVQRICQVSSAICCFEATISIVGRCRSLALGCGLLLLTAAIAARIVFCGLLCRGRLHLLGFARLFFRRTVVRRVVGSGCFGLDLGFFLR